LLRVRWGKKRARRGGGGNDLRSPGREKRKE